VVATAVAGRPPRILAIDPGPLESGWLLWDGPHKRPLRFGISPNDELLASLRTQLRGGAQHGAPDVVVIEKIVPYGMIVGAEVFDTVWWAGRFTEAARPIKVVQLPRLAVKLAICGDSRAKDANINQALRDRFGGSKAKGTKAHPGPLYGITSHVWSALAIAVTFAETGQAA
jgi:hypothetical protein